MVQVPFCDRLAEPDTCGRRSGHYVRDHEGRVLKIASPRAIDWRSGGRASASVEQGEDHGIQAARALRRHLGIAGSISSGSLMPMQNG